MTGVPRPDRSPRALLVLLLLMALALVVALASLGVVVWTRGPAAISARASPRRPADAQAAPRPTDSDTAVLVGLVTPEISGAPLLATNGSVYGMVFACDLEERGSGYAVTAREISTSAEEGRTRTRGVPTGGCAS